MRVCLRAARRGAHAEFLAPARKQGVGIARKGFEGAREFAVLPGPLHRLGARLPAFVRLLERNRSSGRAVDVPVRAAARGVDDVSMPQVLEEAGQAQRVHSARNDRGRGLHSVPLLVVGGAAVAVALDRVRNGTVVPAAFHLAVPHGADMDARRALQARHLGQHERVITPLGAGRGDHAVPGAVVMQVLVGVLAARRRHHARSAHEAIHQERQLVGVRAEGGQREVGAGAHLVMVVGRAPVTTVAPVTTIAPTTTVAAMTTCDGMTISAGMVHDRNVPQADLEAAKVVRVVREMVQSVP